MSNGKTKICIFYDGYYFKKVSDFYKFTHSIQKRISFFGLQTFIVNQAAEAINENEKNCVIAGQHYYIGKLAGTEVNPESAKKELIFQDVLKRAGITGHYRELKTDVEGNKIEKMVDCDLITDALEMAMKGEYDFFILIAGDSDFVPLIEKLKKYVTTMLVFWDIEESRTRTSSVLINTVDYFVEMKPIIEKRMKTELEKGLFENSDYPRPLSQALPVNPSPVQGSTYPAQPSQSTYAPQPSPFNPNETWTLGNQKGVPPPAIPIENLRMDFEPRALSDEELSRVYESAVITLDQEGRFGYVRGPAHFDNKKLNNFQFEPYDVTDYNFSALTYDTRVTFRLKEDPRRSKIFGYPLYKAYDVTPID
ncbi:MAG: NYN domain-containing protein [Spirochaetaceae bacterium]|jgi:uncharacterized LabA/DUF88 family protein|nr:NYN domain-containing protein [Spirochaetaceae bacterium]